MYTDTICAPATSPVNSALAIIRISGSEALAVAGNIFSGKKYIEHSKSVFGVIKDGENPIDDVILTYYKSPKSFTGEDVVEISCHGNPLIVQKILKTLLKNNLRLAEPGEFSKRAFLNGKIDLTEAEAINSVINARSDWELQTSLAQMHGSLKKAVDVLREKIVNVKADTECGIDFMEEDIEFISNEQAIQAVCEIKKEIQSLLKRCTIGEKVSHGITIAIAGKPNVGKSSILNFLINSERAIVSDIPGTTRDMIRESVQFAGVHVNFVDTAGIRDTEDVVEKMGIDRSRKAVVDSNAVIFVFDGSNFLDGLDIDILKTVPHRNSIYLINKSDLFQSFDVCDFKKFVKDSLLSHVKNYFSDASSSDLDTDSNQANNSNNASEITDPSVINFSAITGEGLSQLEDAIKNIIATDFEGYKSGFIADMRVIDLLEKALSFSDSVLSALHEKAPLEIIAFELQQLMNCLSEITGEISPDDVLGSVFSRFCIGK